jgi:hypothetical protein
LSGTLEIEAETERLKQENVRLNAIILQTRKEKKQIEKENERLAELESKIDSLFFKYGITSNPVNKPKQL